ncbi:MAG TPA: TonB-dependent receptor [Steroidobacteraceae bacterium]|nr:TonB-dependent receptor [Steroidobacteraceae bacterium]
MSRSSHGRSSALRRGMRHVLFASGLLCTTLVVQAQTASGTLRGQVHAPDGAPATVTATNTQTGFARTVQSATGGAYAIPGLPPGTYRVDVNAGGQTSSRTVILQVGQTATLDLDVAPTSEAPVETVTVTATQLFETRTSEVAYNVTTREIQALPQNSRNFLAFADIVPGVQLVNSPDGSTSQLRSGAQSANGVNVFIDGVGQKNYVLSGGISGQTATRGNPFPQLAIAEYRVITSNYKAEFDQLSSAAVVAATRSGTNEFEADGFWDRTSENWRAADPIEAKAGKKVPSTQEQYGVAFGGPIIRDVMHFFLTYEAKTFESPESVTYGRGIASLPNFDQFVGPTSTPFDEDLFFGKIDWSIGDAHLLELTFKYRDESEITSVGDQTADPYATSRDNTEKRVDLRYQLSADRFLNDAHLTYEDASFNPRPKTNAPGQILTTGNRDDVVLRVGGGPDFQRKSQKGWSIQDDLTFNAFDWAGRHTVKTGLKYKQIKMNAFEQQPYNPQFYYDINTSTSIPYRVEFGAPLPGVPDPNIESTNKQFGIYLQDDWEINEHWLANIGVRWDYERTPAWENYVTPGDVVAAINSQDPNAAAGQTYAQTLALGGIDINDYISTGNNRDAFTGGIQPRLGLSYDLFGDERHVIFAGAGRAYDRNVFDYLAIEQSKGTFPTYTRTFDAPGHPCDAGATDCIAWDPAYFDRANLEALVASNPSFGREVDLINNNLRTPYSDQYSLGMRNRISIGNQDWNTTATLSYIRSKDRIVFLLGNRRPDGTFFEPGSTWGTQPWGFGLPGLGTLLIGRNGIETRSKMVLLQAEKPYTRESGWSATFAYTFTDATENRTRAAEADEHYIFDYPTVGDFGWHTSTGIPKHRLVATGIVDAPWEMTLSAKLTLSTPLQYEAIDCFNVDPQDGRHCYFHNFQPSGTLGYKQFDLALEKGWSTFSDDLQVRLRADILNVFNSENAAGFDNWRGDGNGPNANFGDPTQYYQPTRTFKLSFNVNWK